MRPTLATPALAGATRVVPVSGLIAALIGYGVFLFAPQVLNDGDTYSHLATGAWMLAHDAVPRTDPFSFSFAGQPWVAHEWLSELAMGVAFRLAGWSGVLILFGLTAALTFFCLARHLARWLDPLPAFLFLMAAATCIAPSMLARPHFLALPALELWTAGLLIARERNRVQWTMLPLMFLWANLHGSFIFGLFLAGPFALEAVAAARAKWRLAAITWSGFIAAATLLAMATPFGWHGLLFPFQLLQMKTLGGIAEWRVPDFQTIQPIEIALMAALYTGFTRGAIIPPIRLLTVLGVLHLAFQHTRHQMLAGVVGALVLAAPFGRVLNAATHPLPKKSRKALAPVFAVLLVGLAGARLAVPASRVDDSSSPIAALARVPPKLAAQPVLNQYDFGGYLIFRGVRPFIDGRADMYGDAFLTNYGEMMQPDPKLLARTLTEYRIAWTLLAAGAPAVGAMDAMPGWHRLYADAFAVVHVRDDIP